MMQLRSNKKALIVLLGLIVGGLLVGVPLLYVVATALKTQGQYEVRPLQLWPAPMTLRDFRAFFSAVNVLRAFKNTFLITGLASVGTVISCAIVAFPLARMQFRGRKVITLIVLLTMLVPGQVLLIPQYILFIHLHWNNTILPLTVPLWLATSGFTVFFLRQSFRLIPRELDDSVLVDGGSYYTAFRRVIVPLSRTPLLIALILQAVASYNDYLGQLVYLHSPDKLTMAVEVPVSGTQVSGLTAFPVVTAGALIFVLPIGILFLIAQKRLTRGIGLAGSSGR